MAKTKFRLSQFLRFVTAALFLVVAVSIAVNLITHSRQKAEVPLLSDETYGQKVERQEKIEHFEAEGQKGNLQISADEHYYAEEENRYHLKGNVKIIFPKKREDQDVFIYADEITYDKEHTHFVLKGNGRIKFKDFTVESSYLEYDSKEDVFKTNKGAQVSSERLSGSARKLVYLAKQEKIELRENIFIQLKPNLDTSLPLLIQGNKFDYFRKKRQGTMEGNVNLFHGVSLSSADYLEFELFEDEENVKRVFLKGKVNAQLIEEEKNKRKRMIRADEIRIRAFPNEPNIRAIRAQGNCSFKSIASSGSFTQIQAGFIDFILSREGELRELLAKQNAKMTEQGEESENRRIIEGDVLTLKNNNKLLHIKADQQFHARIVSQGSEILASDMIISLDTNDLEVKGGVKIIMNPPEREEDSIGFFSKQEPVFITAQEMRYSGEQKRFVFNEDIKMWQQKKTLFAKEVELNEETGAFFCTGDVKTIIPYKPENREEEERVEISANRMNFYPEKNIISYEEESSLKVENIDLKAQSVSVHLGGEKGEMKEIVAKGGVTIVQNQHEGRGNEAHYDVAKEIIVLLGNPVLIDQDKGKTGGDKLTFHISDGRIVIENKGRERSVTVIKS